jgi:outer membrane protease
MGDGDGNESWTQWSKHVLIELERLNDCYKQVDQRLNTIEQNLSANNVKLGFQSTLFGILGGAIPVVVTLAIYFLEKM